jgi:hypothetical protein
VGAQIVSLLFQKVVVDPVWAWFFGTTDAQRQQTLMSELVPIITERVMHGLPAAAQASDGGYRCERSEQRAACQMRLEAQARYGFDVYAAHFVAAYHRCVAQMFTGSRVYDGHQHQVKVIGICLSHLGYAREVALIDNSWEKFTTTGGGLAR